MALHAELLKASKASSTAAVAAAGRGVGSGGGATDRGGKTGIIGVGDRVDGRFEAGVEWFPAIVTKVRCLEGHGGAVGWGGKLMPCMAVVVKPKTHAYPQCRFGARRVLTD